MKEISNYPVVEEVKNFDEKIDLYICVMGFEDRCLGSNKKLSDNNFKSKQTIIIKYDVYKNENEANRDEFEDVIAKFSDKFSFINYKTGKSRNEFLTEFKNEIAKLKFVPNSISINITGMTNHSIISLIDFALDAAKVTKIIYTEPQTYTTQLRNSTSFTSGVEDIFTLPNFSGATLPGYPTLLVVTMGYDLTRPRGIISELQPTNKIGIMTSPNLKIMNDPFNKIKNEHELLFGKNNLEILSIFDYESIIKCLERIRQKHVQSHNIIIALTGSKLLAISVLLFLKKYKDIQLILSTPVTYHPDRYSKGIGRTFMSDIEADWFKKFL